MCKAQERCNRFGAVYISPVCKAQLNPGPIPDARGATSAARLKFDDGGGWTRPRGVPCGVYLGYWRSWYSATRTGARSFFFGIPAARCFSNWYKKRPLIGPVCYSLNDRITAVIGFFDWLISVGFDWPTKQHNNREKQQKNRRKWRVIKTNNKQQTHTEGKGKMSQKKQVGKNSATVKQEEKNANSAKESK